jgi:L-serine dehydratase
MHIRFSVEPLPWADHPNAVQISLESRERPTLIVRAVSTGGGGIHIHHLAGWPVSIDGKSHEVLVVAAAGRRSDVLRMWQDACEEAAVMDSQEQNGRVLFRFRVQSPIAPDTERRLMHLSAVENVWIVAPVFYVQRGKQLFNSGEEMIRFASTHRLSLGQAALSYEAQLLGISEEEATGEMIRRLSVMKESVRRGFEERSLSMQLLHPTARRIFEAEAAGRVALGGPHTRAATRAMAALHTGNSQGVIVAAPTGGAAGTIPGVVLTLTEELQLTDKQAARALFAAGAVGRIVAMRATFAAEVAGCQVEIGAAGAMAAAAVVEATGGSAAQAADAAAISFQNTMGSVCDLVQGMCEVPCHTRNAVAASGAFVCADLVLGGYENPVPLDETIDAVYASGKMLPRELRVTSLGGLAMAPSARSLPNLRTSK